MISASDCTTNAVSYPSWVSFCESFASTLLQYRNREPEMADALSSALAACAVQFPIAESGEELWRFCPFTVFSSFCREMRPKRRSRLSECLSQSFALQIDALTPEQAECPGLHEVNQRELRFFSSRHDTQDREVDSLWDLFEKALSYADNPDGTTRKEEFLHAYDLVMSLRTPNRHNIPTALSWIRPRFYLPTPCLDLQSRSVITAKDYLDLLQEYRNQDTWASCSDGISNVFKKELESWAETHAARPSVDKKAVRALVRDYRENRSLLQSHVSEKMAAIRCFREAWDVHDTEFAAMIERALSGYDSIVMRNPTFNPHKDILVIARNDPEATRFAFQTLFDRSRPSLECAVDFEKAIAQLFERNRGQIVSAIPRRSSHGNFYSISAYLFLRFPEEEYLFSPTRINALAKATGYNGPFRVAEPESMEIYAEICAAVREEIMQEGLELPKCESEEIALHVLVDEIAEFAAHAR